jgi:hypothetical protein
MKAERFDPELAARYFDPDIKEAPNFYPAVLESHPRLELICLENVPSQLATSASILNLIKAAYSCVQIAENQPGVSEPISVGDIAHSVEVLLRVTTDNAVVCLWTNESIPPDMDIPSDQTATEEKLLTILESIEQLANGKPKPYVEKVIGKLIFDHELKEDMQVRDLWRFFEYIRNQEEAFSSVTSETINALGSIPKRLENQVQTIREAVKLHLIRKGIPPLSVGELGGILGISPRVYCRIPIERDGTLIIDVLSELATSLSFLSDRQTYPFCISILAPLVRKLSAQEPRPEELPRLQELLRDLQKENKS